jgi:hypothetical protein
VRLLLDGFATFRLTRLATTDDILDRPRAALTSRSVFLDRLLSCAWCASIYVAAVVVAVRAGAPGLWDPLAKVLAFSAVAGLLAYVTGD